MTDLVILEETLVNIFDENNVFEKTIIAITMGIAMMRKYGDISFCVKDGYLYAGLIVPFMPLTLSSIDKERLLKLGWEYDEDGDEWSLFL